MAGINLLPLAVLLQSAADACRYYRGRDNRTARNRYLVIALLLFVLIYPLPAALVLYWFALNLSSSALAALTSAVLGRRRRVFDS